MSTPAILVLGGSGFVGRHVVRRLAAVGYHVIVPTRRRERAKHLILLPTVDVLEADIHDRATLVRLASGTGTIVNLVGILNETQRGDFRRAHVELAANVVAASRAAGVRLLLHMSALNAAPDGPSEYLRTKGEAAAIVAASGLAHAIFEPSVIFGPEDSFLNLFAKLQRLLPVLALACANARFQPVYVGDVAAAFVQALTDEAIRGERMRLCGPKVYTLRELVTYVGELTRCNRPIVELGPRLSSLQARVLERLPGKLMSRDNLASMQLDSVCACDVPASLGIVPTAIEAVAPGYLGPAAARDRFDNVRPHSGR